MSGKLLMFAKLSLESFIYNVVETFCFPTEKISSLYKKIPYRECWNFSHVLADTDRKALKFIFTSDPNRDLPEDIFRDLPFQVIVTSKVYKRFDSSHKFSDILGVGKTSRQKKLGYYEIENIDNPCVFNVGS